MKVKQITLGKDFKVGLPSFSNLTLTCHMTFELGENEELEWDKMWDTINYQMYIQSSGIDQSWIISKEYKNFFRTVVKSVKTGELKYNEKKQE